VRKKKRNVGGRRPNEEEEKMVRKKKRNTEGRERDENEPFLLNN